MARGTVLALLAVPFLDEIEAGVLPIATPELGSEFGVSGATAFAILSASVYLLAMLVEAPLFARADRARRADLWLRGGLLGVAVACFLAALAPSLIWLAAAVALLGPGSGLVCGLAQGRYVGADLAQAERRMTRWTLAAAAGDLVAPALVTAVLFLGLGWRTALVIAGCGSVLLALTMPLRAGDMPPRQGEDEEEKAPLRSALRIRGVMPWALATTACTFLDEIALAYGALHVTARHGPGAGHRALVLGALVAGSVAGLLVLERCIGRDAEGPASQGSRSFDGRRWLLLLSLVSALSLLGWVLAPTPWLAAIATFVLGMSCAGHYPLAKAQAYRTAPGRPGAVNAVLALLTPLELIAPFLMVGVLAFGGTSLALIALTVQPLAIVAVLCLTRTE